MKYSVINVTENDKDKPDFVSDSIWKEIQGYIDDEELMVVLSLKDHLWYPADEFFSMMGIMNFETIDDKEA